MACIGGSHIAIPTIPAAAALLLLLLQLVLSAACVR